MRLAILFVLAMSSLSLAVVEVTYDKFTDKTSVTSSEIHTEPDENATVTWSFFREFPGKKVTESNAPVALIATRIASDWGWLQASRDLDAVLILGSGERMKYPIFKFDSALHGGRVGEIAAFIIPSGDFLKIVNSERIEAKIGNVTMVVRRESIDAIREFAIASKVVPAPPKPPIVVKFEETEAYRRLSSEVQRIDGLIGAASSEVESKLLANPDYKALVAARDAADVARKGGATAQERITASAEYIKQKNAVESFRQKFLDEDTTVAQARQLAANATAELESARKLYNANPTTRPAD